MKIIAITGTPGTGKSTLAKQLEQKLKFKRIDLHRYYQQISTGYSKTKQSYDIDLKKFIQLIKEKSTEANLIVDSHISHWLPKEMINLCIVLICSDLKKLQRRLEERKYSNQKIRENLDAEIFQICLNEAKEKKYPILVFDSSKKIPLQKILNKVTKLL